MDVTVFVDDAVRGRLPDICVKDGVPTRGRTRVTEEIGRSNRLGVLWLLVLAGPIGWLALLFLLSRDSGEYLTVELPYSDGAHARLTAAYRLRTVARRVAVFGGLGLLAVTLLAHLQAAGFALIILTVGAGAIAMVVADYRIGRVLVAVRLDASRRWVALRNVHPAFAAACAALEERSVV
jgi:hypothetical protein